jgi:hypothetical protein
MTSSIDTRFVLLSCLSFVLPRSVMLLPPKSVELGAVEIDGCGGA